MKQATKSSYIKFFNDAINNNRSLKAQCTISGKNINTVYITMRNLRKKENKEFSVSYKRARDIQKEVLIRGAMKGWFNPTAFIFTAKNITDMRDKIETDITSGGQPITGMIIAHAD